MRETCKYAIKIYVIFFGVKINYLSERNYLKIILKMIKLSATKIIVTVKKNRLKIISM